MFHFLRKVGKRGVWKNARNFTLWAQNRFYDPISPNKCEKRILRVVVLLENFGRPSAFTFRHPLSPHFHFFLDFGSFFNIFPLKPMDFTVFLLILAAWLLFSETKKNVPRCHPKTSTHQITALARYAITTRSCLYHIYTNPSRNK